MNGFFDMGVTTSTEHLCSECRLDKGCLHPKMSLTGGGRLQTLIIAEAPGEEEDRLNKQLIGDVGQWLRKRLHKRDLDLDEDFWKTNSIICRPPKNREPTRNELVSCHPNIEKAIRENKPKFIWLLGGSAIETFYMNKFSYLAPSRWRGLCIPDFDTGAWIIPMFHPSYAYRNKENTLITSQFDRDLDFAIECVKTKGPIKDIVRPDINDVRIMTDFDEVCDILEDFIIDPPSKLFFDYETTGLKPYKSDHKIASISFATDEHQFAYSFPLHYPHWTHLQMKSIERKWKKVLQNSSKKIAHNMKFEEVWSRVILNTSPDHWHWCTMLTAHILDNRRKFTGLKFQSFIRWGIPNYDKEIKPYLESENEKGFNRVMEAPLNKLLLYGGIDSLLTKWLYNAQIQEVDEHLEKGIDLFTEGTLTLADIQINGINCDVDYYHNSHKELEHRVADKLEELLQFKECREFEKITGRLPNLGSSDDLKQMFFNILGFKPPRITEKGNASVDKDTMSKIDSPLAKEITAINLIKKIDGTYITQFLREIDPDGRIHPFFDIGQIVTYRSCLAKGTLVHVVRDFIEYPKGVPIETVKKGDFVYCFDDNLKPTIRKVLWAGKTGHKKVKRLYWKARSGKGYLDITPENLVRLTTGDYIPAEKFNDELFIVKNKNPHNAFKRTLALHRVGDELYFSNNTKNGHGILEHRFIYEKLIGPLSKEDLVHHKNLKHLDHTPLNLEKKEIAEHSRLHSTGRGKSEDTRKKIGKNTKQNWKDGKYDHVPGMKKLHLSEIDCLRSLVIAKGKPTKVPYDYSVFLNYCRKYNINWKNIKLRYDKEGKYISKKRLLRLHMEKGIETCRKILGHNYYRLKSLYEYYNIPFERRWGNQNGSFVPHNHIIYKVVDLPIAVDVYDLEIEEFNNFFANEICVHNSSSSPNFQNVPVRNEEAKRYARSGIIPSKGFQILDFDYAAIEVRVGACYTKDPVLIKYIKDPSTDMHRDTASDIFKLQPSKVTKNLRFYTKNGFVFPEWYGSYYKNCAANIWNECRNLKTGDDITVADHLEELGVSGLEGFTEHVKRVEEKYWKKFKVFKEWQEDWYKSYEKKGYIELLTGFRCTGYMGRNELVNYPFQGTAFHCLLWSLIMINALLKERKMESRVIAQIHDNGIIDCCPDEHDEVKALCTQISTLDIRDHFKWINVPLEIEWESGGIDESWYAKTVEKED